MERHTPDRVSGPSPALPVKVLGEVERYKSSAVSSDVKSNLYDKADLQKTIELDGTLGETIRTLQESIRKISERLDSLERKLRAIDARLGDVEGALWDAGVIG